MAKLSDEIMLFHGRMLKILTVDIKLSITSFAFFNVLTEYTYWDIHQVGDLSLVTCWRLDPNDKGQTKLCEHTSTMID